MYSRFQINGKSSQTTPILEQFALNKKIIINLPYLGHKSPNKYEITIFVF